ncbi:MAG: hypothetical protein HY731_07010 [Candidatus Tectomicrobia bacterium]|nr:hypothetical protein [Candidatus Tectomicrobia bacterium]
MTPIEQALITIASFLDTAQIPYMTIGGIANLVWGIPRATLDVDITIWVEESRIARLLVSLRQKFLLLPDDPLAFIQETRVLPIETQEGIRTDLIFGQLPYEEQAIRRAIVQEFHGTPVRICSPEDLIIHKIISERHQDREDVRGIIQRLGAQLDRGYLDPLIHGLSSDLNRPEIVEFFEHCFHEREEF